MNERIKELVEQAGFIRFSPDEDCDTPIDWSCDYTTALEKFAELIVRECGVALSPMLRDMVSRGQAYDLIKDHFGVEE